MKRYKVETQREGSVKYFFIRDMESLEIVLLPSKSIRDNKASINPQYSSRYLPISTGKRSDIEQGHPTQYQIRI